MIVTQLNKLNCSMLSPYQVNHVSGVIISILASSMVDRGFEPQSGQTKKLKWVFSASPLSTQH